MSSFPKTKVPSRPSVLDSWIGTKAAEDGEDVARLRRNVSYMVVAAVLARLTGIDGTPLFVLKGGVSMQLRFGIRARFSRDYDAVFRRGLDQLEEVLAEAPSHPVGPFIVRPLGKPEPIGPTGALRQTLDVRFGPSQRGWAKVHLEISQAEGHSVEPHELDWLDPLPDLSTFGLDPQGLVPCMPVAYQIAQKIHACTEDLEHKDNERFHDLLDLQLLAEIVDGEAWTVVRAACEEVFTGRRKHTWPPSITLYPEWPTGYAKLASDNGFPIGDIETAIANVETLIARIAAA